LHLALLAQEGAPFESPALGVRLRIPPAWNIDTTPRTNQLLRINKGGAGFAFPPVISAQDLSLTEPIPRGQLKEKLCAAFQSGLAEARIQEEEELAKIGGQSAFAFRILTKTPLGEEVVALRTVIGDGPVRYVSVDADFPKASYAPLRADYDALLRSLELFPRRPPDWAAEAAPGWAETLKKLAAEPPPPAAAGKGVKEELVLTASQEGKERRIGRYSLSVRQEARDGADGLAFEFVHEYDLGASGKQEARTVGWVSRDLSRQEVAAEEFRLGEDKRAVYFTARGSLAAGRLSVERRINGEAARQELAAAPGTVIEDVLELLQWRLSRSGERRVAVPALSLYDPAQPRPWLVQVGGPQKVKDGAEDLSIEAGVALMRQDGQRFAYWYGAGGGLLQWRSERGPAFRRAR
jgi:hypothetical protein